MARDTHGDDLVVPAVAGGRRLSRRGVLRAGAAVGIAASAGAVGADRAMADPGTSVGAGAQPAHVPGWDMKDRDDPSRNTHLWIVVQSLEMLKPLTGPQGAAARMLLQLTNQYGQDLRQGIWDADNVDPWNGPWGSYAHHFFNPRTGRTFIPCTEVVTWGV